MVYYSQNYINGIALVRGDNLQGIRAFIDIEGVELMDKVIREENPNFTLKMRTRASFLLKELIHHDENLLY